MQLNHPKGNRILIYFVESTVSSKKQCVFFCAFSYRIVCEVPCPRLPYNEPGTTYTVLKYPEDVHASVATIPTTLRFMARDCDPATGVPDAEQGYNDEYMVHFFPIIQLTKLSLLNHYSHLNAKQEQFI